MNKYITVDNVPYLLTIFVVLTGWTLTEITKDLASIPVISFYEVVCKNNSGNRCLVFKNISKHIVFKDLKITIFDKKLSCDKVPDISPISGIELSESKQPSCTDSRSILQELNSFQPEASIMIKYKTSSIEGKFYIAADANGAVRVLEQGFWTFIIEKKRNILLFLLMIWAIGIFWMSRKE